MLTTADWLLSSSSQSAAGLCSSSESMKGQYLALYPKLQFLHVHLTLRQAQFCVESNFYLLQLLCLSLGLFGIFVLCSGESVESMV